MVSRRQKLALFLLALVCAAAFAAGASPLRAAPVTNSAIEAARRQAADANKRLDELATELEMRSEAYLEIESELATTRGRIDRTEERISVTQAQLDDSQARLSQRASEIYRSGGIDVVSVFLGVTDFKDFVSRLDLMRRIGMNDASLVAGVKSAKSELENARSTLERRKAEQVVLRDRARVAQAEVNTALKEQKAFLATIDSKLKVLIAQERARQERLALEAAAREAAARAPHTAYPPGRVFDAAALGAGHPEVLDVARRYVNVTPYVWGGTTPAGFDCSGLTQFCYREIGVELPRTSRQQFHIGAYIPPDRLDLLQPGDLLFFGFDGDPTRIHHVALFAGNGEMVHAPATGELVSVSSLLARIDTRGDYVGAARP